MKLLNQRDYDILLVEHKDRLTSLALIIKNWLESTERKVEYGLRRAKEKTQ